MREMIKARKEQLQKRGKKGFTLMEMLIVVAIIAVLIAIAIPVFLGQLESARDATSVANMRSAYAEASTALLTGDSADNVTIAGKKVTVTGVKLETQVADNWNGKDADLPFKAATDPGEAGTYSIEFDFTDSSKVTSTLAKTS